MADHDAIIIGSGINSLVCAALLTRAGWSVCVLERERRLGGCIFTSDELTLPGFTHEVLAAWHPLFTGSPAYAELAGELELRGVRYLNTDLPTGTVFPDGSAAFMWTSADAQAAELDRFSERDGGAWRTMAEGFLARGAINFGLLGTELWSPAGMRLAASALRSLGVRGLSEHVADMFMSCRDWSTATFRSEQARGLLAPWVLHAGLGPDQAGSGFMAQLVACALTIGGMPVPQGGGVRLVDALAGIIRDGGGDVRAEAAVEHIVVSGDRARGVRLSGGETLAASRAVIAGVSPRALYGALLAGDEVPAVHRERALNFRQGRAAMQIHLALDEPPRWRGDRAQELARTPIVHVTPGLDGVSRAVNEADRGLLPVVPTIVCGQPCVLDPARAPAGKAIIWIQLQELPPGPVKGDAAAEIDVGDGGWTAELREAYADRVLGALAEAVENLERATLKRVALSPVDIAALNVNLTNGDIYGGACTIDQSLVWRPFARAGGHRTAVAGLWHIGASTHPGPGLAAGSGYLVASALRRPGVASRVVAHARRS
jgi:phytoene dehydrogenase-like protein